MKRLFFTFALLALAPPLLVYAAEDSFVIELLQDEAVSAPPPFSLTRVEVFGGRLRLFFSTGDISRVAGLLAASGGRKLQAQLSDNTPDAESETEVTLSLGTAVWCQADAAPAYLPYGAGSPVCDAQPPARIEYYFEVPITLGSQQDLAIGLDPDFLWLIGPAQ
ncbi:MAG: hypothetical protein L0387_38665 [Acidobacteria bacterium]|nr:hypothetical protein [Acidobacteriota bacterium]MCI0721673.1 hypothetical protein [Acidobacteriota bacterium]